MGNQGVNLRLFFGAALAVYCFLICSPDKVSADSNFDIQVQDELLSQLSARLTSKECWFAAHYLARETSDPVIKKTISKIGGHSKEFKCFEALKYWNEFVLPASEGSNKIEVEGVYAKLMLADAVEFVRRKELVEWVLNWSPDKNGDAEEDEDDDKKEDGPASKIQDILYRTAPSPKDEDKFHHADKNDDFFVRFQLTDSEADNDPSASAKRRIDVETELYANILKYVVASVLALVMICFIVTILMVCLRHPRRPHRPNYADEIGMEDIDDLPPSGEYIQAKKQMKMQQQQQLSVKILSDSKSAGAGAGAVIQAEVSSTDGNANVVPENNPDSANNND